MWTNYHTHCNYCDGKNEPEEIIERANQENLKSIGFSSHAPLPFEKPWAMRQENLIRYLRHITKLKANASLEVYVGLEVDYIPGLVSPDDFPGLDYTIGSVHFVDSFSDGIPWEIDSTTEVFRRGLSEIFDNHTEKAIARYYEITRDMVGKSGPTIIGHLDKIKIHNRNESFFDENASWYRDEIVKTIHSIANTNCIVEVNTRGQYQGKTTDTYPGNFALQVLRERRVPVTLSSDAHSSTDIVCGFRDARKLLVDHGFDAVVVMTGGKWTPIPLSEYGQ